MKFQAEYRDPARVHRLAAAIRETVTRPWTVMEVCGGQTHAIARFGLEDLLPEGLRLVHGPGCPVCVTPMAALDAALEIAARDEVIFCTFGDMIRVPGSRGDLRGARAAGADVRVVYAPHDAVSLARENPARQVVFFGVGFETTAPAIALAGIAARRLGLDNFSLLTSMVRVPPALALLAGADGRPIDGFLAPGHVCTVMGTEEYAPLVEQFRVPMVVTGFEPVDLLRGLLCCVTQLESGRAEVENAYTRAVRPEGNPAAKAIMVQCFEARDQVWRGIGLVPGGGLGLRPAFASIDAALRFPCQLQAGEESPECQAGLVLQGRLRPPDCPAFGTRCTPEAPLGAPMVSTEGACAAYFRYRRPA